MNLPFKSVCLRFAFAINLALTSQSAFGTTTNEQASAITEFWKHREASAGNFTATWIQERTYTKSWTTCHIPHTRDEYVTLIISQSKFVVDGANCRFDSGFVDSGGDEIEFDYVRRTDELAGGFNSEGRRYFRNERLRYDRGRKPVDTRTIPPDDWPRNLRAFTTIFDGKKNLHFLPEERGQYPEGYVFRAKKNLFGKSLYYLPLILNFRPSWLNIHPSQVRFKPDPQRIGEHECLVALVDGGLPRELWLDPKRDFVPLCYVEECDVMGVRMKNRINIQYAQSADGTWIPSAWTTLFFDSQGLTEHYAATTVTNFAFNSSTASEFDFQFPPNTWVYDERSDEHSIVLPNDVIKPISRAELQSEMTYLQLRRKGTWIGRAFNVTIGSYRTVITRPFAFVAAILIITLPAMLLYRRHRLRTR